MLIHSIAKTQKLLTLLEEEGLLTKDQRTVLDFEHERTKKSLPSLLLDFEYITPLTLLEFLSKITLHPFINIEQTQFPNELPSSLLPLWRSHQVFPFFFNQQEIKIAMEDPDDITKIDDIKRHLIKTFHHNILITPYHALSHDILLKLEHSKPTKEFNTADNPLEVLENLLKYAVQNGVSDIHFQPEETQITVRIRLNGLMQAMCVLHPSISTQIINRLKVLSHLDVIETRRPQSGHFDMKILSSHVDIRVSTHPTFYGENVVLRLLDKAKRVLSLHELGFKQEQARLLEQLTTAPQGMIIITGPTGSGKTTTLYALLAAMDANHRNIMTLESPIEAHLKNIQQTEIKDENLLSYAGGIRSLLRQDPDVILIGEIRDEDTAKMALRAVLTGHLVLSTMHTQDTLGVTSRLVDLGISPTSLSGTLNAVVAQRLVRQLCVCQNTQGCEICHYTRFNGQMALVEILPFDEEMNALIASGGNRTALYNIRAEKKIPTLLDHGLHCVKENKTTMEELYRVLGDPSLF